MAQMFQGSYCFKNCHLSSTTKTFKMHNRGNTVGVCVRVCVGGGVIEGEGVCVCVYNYIGLILVLCYTFWSFLDTFYSACITRASESH